MTWERDRPKIKKMCQAGCRVTLENVAAGTVIVSPSGCAHLGAFDGVTYCGKDATGPAWWWPV